MHRVRESYTHDESWPAGEAVPDIFPMSPASPLCAQSPVGTLVGGYATNHDR